MGLVVAPAALPAVTRPVEAAAGVGDSVVPGFVGVGEAGELPGLVVDVVEVAVVVSDVVLPGTIGLLVVPGLVLVGLSALVEVFVPDVVLGTTGHGALAPGVAAAAPPVAPGVDCVPVVLGSVLVPVVPAFGVGRPVPIVVPVLGVTVPVGLCCPEVPTVVLAPMPTPGVVLVPTPVVVLVPTSVVVLVPTPVVVVVVAVPC